MNAEENNINSEELMINQNYDPDIEVFEEAFKEIEKLKNSPDEESVAPPLNNSIELAEEEPELDELIIEEEPAAQEVVPKKEPKLWQERNAKFAALQKAEEHKHRAEALEQKNYYLEQKLNEALSSGTYHYGQNAYSELERAKENLEKAYETGNTDNAVKANIALTRATNKVIELENWNYAEEQKKTYNSQQPINAPVNQSASYDSSSWQDQAPELNIIQETLAADWLDDHDYLRPDSKNYDEKLANQIFQFSEHLNENLARNNQNHLYFSDGYFKAIDKHIAKIKNNSPQNKNPANFAPVGAVRNSPSTNNTSPTKIRLDENEKQLAASFQMSEAEWIKNKLITKTGKN